MLSPKRYEMSSCEPVVVVVVVVVVAYEVQRFIFQDTPHPH